MRNIRSEKGITLTSLIIYIIAMLIVVGIISTISVYYYRNIDEINKEVDVAKEYTKLNSYLSEDVNNPDNVIELCNGNTIVFYNANNIKDNDENTGYHQYTFKDNAIYFNRIKICNGVQSCQFIQDETDPSSKFTLNIEFNNSNKGLKSVKYAIRKNINMQSVGTDDNSQNSSEGEINIGEVEGNVDFTMELDSSGTNWKYIVKDSSITSQGDVTEGKLIYSNDNGTTWSEALKTEDGFEIEATSEGIYDIRFVNNQNKYKNKKAYAYVKNGLQLYYDGEYNQNYKHNSSANIWADLSGNGNDCILHSNHTFSEDTKSLNCIKESKTYSVSKNNIFNVRPDNFTVEYNAKFNSEEDGWVWSIRNTWGWEGAQSGQYEKYQFTGLFDINQTNYSEIKYDLKHSKIFSRVTSYGNKGQNIRSYENGNLIKTDTMGECEVENKKLQIAGTNWNDDVSLNGSIYTMRVYNRVLTEEEIQINYKIDKSRFDI